MRQKSHFTGASAFLRPALAYEVAAIPTSLPQSPCLTLSSIWRRWASTALGFATSCESSATSSQRTTSTGSSDEVGLSASVETLWVESQRPSRRKPVGLSLSTGSRPLQLAESTVCTVLLSLVRCVGTVFTILLLKFRFLLRRETSISVATMLTSFVQSRCAFGRLTLCALTAAWCLASSRSTHGTMDNGVEGSAMSSTRMSIDIRRRYTSMVASLGLALLGHSLCVAVSRQRVTSIFCGTDLCRPFTNCLEIAPSFFSRTMHPLIWPTTRRSGWSSMRGSIVRCNFGANLFGRLGPLTFPASRISG